MKTLARELEMTQKRLLKAILTTDSSARRCGARFRKHIGAGRSGKIYPLAGILFGRLQSEMRTEFSKDAM